MLLKTQSSMQELHHLVQQQLILPRDSFFSQKGWLVHYADGRSGISAVYHIIQRQLNNYAFL